MNKKQHSKKNFIRYEFIYVMIIIAILMFIILPPMIAFYNQACETTCKANTRTLTAFTMLWASLDVSRDPDDADQAALLGDNLIESEIECPSGGNYHNNNGVWTCDFFGH